MKTYKMNAPLVLAIYLSPLSFVFSNANVNWFGEEWLDQNYLLKWKNNEIEKIITFKVEVRTKGWVGFGLSRNGKTVNADMIFGWVNNIEPPFFYVSINSKEFEIY